MKTAVSIPNDVYAEADRVARRQGKSRSQLYTEAVREYLARHEAETITYTLNRVCDLIDEPVDPAVSAAAIHLLKRVDW